MTTIWRSSCFFLVRSDRRESRKLQVIPFLHNMQAHALTCSAEDSSFGQHFRLSQVWNWRSVPQGVLCRTKFVQLLVVLAIHSALDFQFCRFIKSLSALFTNLLVFCRRCSQDSGLWLQYLLVPAGTLFRYLENSEAACGITYFGSNAWFCECFLQIPRRFILEKKRKLPWQWRITIFS